VSHRVGTDALITTGISIWYIDRASCRRAARGERGGTEDLAPCNEKRTDRTLHPKSSLAPTGRSVTLRTQYSCITAELFANSRTAVRK
jgi:hypothetical protein